MEVFTTIPEKKHTAITVGVFDGVHLGHQRLIKRTVELAKKNDIESGVVTFSPYPDEVLRGMKGIALTIDDEKKDLMEQLGIDFMVVLKFSEELANLVPYEFAKMITPLNPLIIVLGKDFSFGKGRAGNVETLSRIFRNSLIEAVPLVEVEGSVVKSSTIRNLISEGRMNEAELLLGRRYSVKGKIVKGKGKGRELGVPTANLSIDRRKLIPASGVYAGIGYFKNNFFPAGIFIDDELSYKHQIEVHLVGFDSEEIYGEELIVEFISYIRSPSKFESDEKLLEQIKEDLSVIKRHFLEVSRGKN